MEAFDPMRETAVWARVYAAPDSDTGLAAQLAKWVAECHQMAVTYYDLARLAPRHGPALRHLAQDCAGQGVQLTALYITLTGRRLTKPTAHGTLETAPAPLFAQLYRQETEMARQLAACGDSAHAEVLGRQAAQQRRRAADLLTISARYL